ncbi:ROK family transcriptional regulator [Actinomycetes bacterium KLBMP 9759]
MPSVPEETASDDRWSALDGSERLVAVEVLRHGPLPRAELAKRLGLSPPSLTRLTRPLIDSQMLVEGVTEAHRRTGRPSLPLDVRPDARRFIGVKLTGDELFAVVTDLRATVLREVERPLPGRAPAQVIGAVAEVVTTLRETHPDVTALGITLGGFVTGHRHVAGAYFLGWTDVPLADEVAAASGLPTVAENDVRALTAAEHWFGAGRGCRSFAMVTIGAGIGTGFVVHDRVIEGHHGASGAITHRSIGGSAVCEQGHRGCASALLSSYHLTADMSRAIGSPVTYPELLELAGSGHPAARRIVGDAGHALGLLVTDIVNFLDPEVVFLSGEGVGLVEHARPQLEATIAEYRVHDSPPVRVEVLDRPFSQWARGAAAVAIQSYVTGRV